MAKATRKRYTHGCFLESMLWGRDPMCRLLAVIVAIAFTHLIAMGVSPADARQNSDWRGCNARNADERISACTRIIDRGRESANNRASAYNNRGIAYFSKGENDRAIRDFDEAIQLKPRNHVLLYNRGFAYSNQSDYDRAIQDYDEAISLYPKYTIAFNDRGNAYYRKGDYDKAIRGYDDAIRLDPRNAIAYANRANAYRMKADYDRAIRDFDESIRLDPKDSGALRGRGQLYADKGDYGRAISDLTEAIRRRSDDADSYNVRGFVYKQQGENDSAIRDLDQAIKLQPKLALAFSNRGDAWRQRGDVDRAIIDLDEAIRLDPSMTPAYVNRGLAYEKKGDIERAKIEFGTALAKAPGKFTTTKEAREKARERLMALGATPAATVSADAQPQISPGPVSSSQVSPSQAAVSQASPAPVSLNESGTIERGPRVALVIGNGAYANVSPLSNPSNDAREMAGALRELGFKVIEGYNLDSTTMRGRIADFGAALPGAGVSLFYYAGHGMQVAGKNYLIPVDAKLERPSSLGVEAIEVGTVLSDMEAEKRINLVFLDACRDNPLSRSLARSFGTSRAAAVGQGLAQLNAGIGTLITFATSPDTVALDGSGKNSPFTAAMLKYIRTPGLEIRSMLTRVRADVIRATNERQVPWDHSSLTGDFYFRPGS
jgi:tetratricopeptide (TPR) repeat protein